LKDIESFIEGFRRFKADYFSGSCQRFEPYKTCQQPTTAVIGCCDSRVDPAILFGCGPGDLFVIRNVANLVPPCEHTGGHHGISAAIEFAVKTLKVKHVIVLGHSHCGGINALLSGAVGAADGGFIGNWMALAEGARSRVLDKVPEADGPDARARACEQASILVSLENLMSFPWLKARVDDGSLHLHGWYFDTETGGLMRYSTSGQAFEALA